MNHNKKIRHKANIPIVLGITGDAFFKLLFLNHMYQYIMLKDLSIL